MKKKVSTCSSAHVVVGDGRTAANENSVQFSYMPNLSPVFNNSPSEFDKAKVFASTQLKPTKMQYATAPRRRGLPSFAQSVVCDVINGATNDDYMDQFEKITPINNLIFFLQDFRECASR